MKRLVVDIDEGIYDKVMWFLNQIPKDKVEIIDDTLFTQEDEEAYEIALKELENNETLSLEELEKELFKEW
ncbi:hypothetical protein MBAV_006013 [Candidatus Magnetobacterium bavaricum]|uniref:Uncharacterized protein n=1 Tax=Candidatus Magnetobacterium bavaricum TaxID=29290 RepID=A0A0F3GIM1_9BACT|nr:hypothetical protein MBAV_006013 [Candidatus Magnetobacterium bavaricum]